MRTKRSVTQPQEKRSSDGRRSGLDMLALERDLWAEGFQRIAGVDEAGRGPLAGPVCAAAVILPPACRIPGVNDSKQLSERQRERLYPVILREALAVAVGLASAEEIDSLNILQATKLAAARALSALQIPPDYVLLDALTLPQLSFPQKAIVRGDCVSQSIAAASIIAKVTRDRLMRLYALEFPEYSFESHKGYPTRLHYERIRQYGLCSIHRRSFIDLGLFDRGCRRSQTCLQSAQQIQSASSEQTLAQLEDTLRLHKGLLPPAEIRELEELIERRKNALRQVR
ncbi:Ribonuclease HII [Candidatus Sumerlaea chitinivorans]|uniref:Ribonuclease HII n=1 Tax=Sumerlaea chitinivorans TaxID=2250252 RepID=A0A2Z4Y5R2_SUMC1|nr:Ribonuclease HII [Candidatus Sumerlaea chitinivorans]